MSRAKTIKIEPFELDDLFKALGASRDEIADICGIGRGTPGWWRFKRTIPVTHFNELASELEKRLKKSKSLTPLECRALDLIAKRRVELEIEGASGTAKIDKQSPFYNLSFRRVKPKLLAQLSIEDLLTELKDRGYQVRIKK